MTLDDVLRTGSVATRFQPIVDLRSGVVFGYEALARGPRETPLETPDALFAEAAARNRTDDLERLCCTRAIDRASAREEEGGISGKLFVNVNPEQVGRSGFLPFLLSRVARAGVHPRSVVLEVTESRIDPDLPTLLRGIGEWRDAGFRIALDDAGAGHSDLRIAAEIVPDYLKLDRSLIRGIDSHRGRRAAVESMVYLSEALSAEVVAEGIETVEELRTVRALGVHHGQGFLLGRPSEHPAPADPVVLQAIRSQPRRGAAVERLHPFAWVPRESPIGAPGARSRVRLCG